MPLPLIHREREGIDIYKNCQQIAKLKVIKIDGLLYKAVKFNFIDNKKRKTITQILRGGEKIPLLPDLTAYLDSKQPRDEKIRIIYDTNNLIILPFEDINRR